MILYRRKNLRGDNHGPPDYGEHPHRNVFLQKIFRHSRSGQHYRQIPGHHTPITISQREIQKQAARTEDHTENSTPTQPTSLCPSSD